MTVTQSLPIVDAVRRRLEIPEPARPQAPVLAVMTLTTNLGPAPAQMWPMLTRLDRLAQWYGPVSGERREGGMLQLPGGVLCRIVEIEAPHKIQLAITPGGTAPGQMAPGESAAGVDAEPLLIRLDPEDDGTTSLRLSHTATIGQGTFERFGPGLVAIGWEIMLLRLAAATDGWRATCLRDVPVPTAGWMSGREGREHVEAWSVRWAAEAIAAGVDEQTARRRERETVVAYRGSSDGRDTFLRRRP